VGQNPAGQQPLDPPHDLDVGLRQFGFAVAQAYAGHEDRGRGARSMAAMATYVRAGLPEVATALAALTGEPHPLAISTGFQEHSGSDPRQWR
jgi:hypothetical protein